jgi:MFS family permease
VATSEADLDGVWAPARRRLTVGLVLTVTLVAFEALSVATILPVVSRQLGDLRLYGWVFSAFLLASLLGIAVTGSLADRFPLVWPMLAGLMLFAVGLVIGGTAADMPVLVLGRAVQGLGAGVVPAAAYAAIGRSYPDRSRPRMFAVLSTAWVVPGLVGPLVAALVSDTVGWRWVFLGLVPLVGLAAALAAPALRSVPLPPATSAVAPRILPAVGIVVGAGLILTGLTSGRAVAILAGLVTGSVLLVVSIRPLTPPGTLVARGGLATTVLSRGMLTFCFYAGDAYVPFALTTVRHTSTVFAGLALSAGTITWTAGAWVQERRIASWGPRRLVRVGEGLVLAGLGLMGAALLPSISPLWGIAAWAVAGLGMGLAYAPLSVTALDRAPRGREGRTTAGLQLTDVLGQALGTGAAGAVVAAGTRGLGDRPGVAVAFGIGALVGLAALVVGARLPDRLVRGAGT